MASYQMKTALAYLLENYDLKVPEQRAGTGSGSTKLRLAIRPRFRIGGKEEEGKR